MLSIFAMCFGFVILPKNYTLKVFFLKSVLFFSAALMQVLDRLEPGLSKSRGITLLDLAEAQARSVTYTYVLPFRT